MVLVFAGGARDDEAPEEEVSAGDGTQRCGVRANKGFYWKEVGSVTVVFGWLFFGFVGVFLVVSCMAHGVVGWKKAGKVREGKSDTRQEAVSACHCLFPSPRPSQPCSALGRSGWWGWAQAVQQLCPAPGTKGLCWPKFRAVPSTVHVSLQALWVHTGLRLLEGPLVPRGHHRSQLAQSWWQGR